MNVQDLIKSQEEIRAFVPEVMREKIENTIKYLTERELVIDERARKVKKAIMDALGVRFELIASKDRTTSINYARKIFVHYCLKAGMTIVKTGQMINRNHSTIITIRDNFEDNLRFDPNFKSAFEAVEAIFEV